jgi:predicted nuclease with TOPRIM domain
MSLFDTRTPENKLKRQGRGSVVRVMLNRLVRLNRTRADLREKFEELIEICNSGSKDIEELFDELINLSRSLTDEQTRLVREKLSSETIPRFKSSSSRVSGSMASGYELSGAEAPGLITWL